jgi:hypothetical protein
MGFVAMEVSFGAKGNSARITAPLRGGGLEKRRVSHQIDET